MVPKLVPPLTGLFFAELKVPAERHRLLVLPTMRLPDAVMVPPVLVTNAETLCEATELVTVMLDE